MKLPQLCLVSATTPDYSGSSNLQTLHNNPLENSMEDDWEDTNGGTDQETATQHQSNLRRNKYSGLKWVDGCVDARIRIDKGRLRTVKMTIDRQDLDGVTMDNQRKLIQHALDEYNALRVEQKLPALQARPWQIAVAAELKSGSDIMVATGTGSGKTISYLLPLLADPSATILVVSPLLSLMEDQVSLEAGNWISKLDLTCLLNR